ncbi:MAG TPA: LLM class flavin-dependent oxidoreductase [Xanthobacteraceae bacterium]|nr:LLM class flavin-dependent oxidoreductase [Xanthobacteraceae bacterium]
MKVCMFHLMPYRDLPADYEQRYNASHIEPIWFDVADADKVGAYYNATLDEMLHAAKAGMHGLCTNQHHQNVYGFMANPSLMGSVLARGTQGQNVAIIQLGSTLPSTTPPTRIAEEYAMLDCISGGRLVAGFPTGLPSDATLSNGVVPIEQRERYREALALVTKAWSARELFAWNGKHYQLGMVNLWPRPIQQPHPPIWIPGAGISATAEYVVDHDHCFCHLSYYGLKSAEEVSDRYWETCARKGRDDNPHRYSFLQLIGVAETDADAERIYGPHAEYFFNKLLYNAPQYQQIPGCLEYEGMRSALRGTIRSSINLRELKAKDFFERGFVVVGSPKTVREKLLDGVKRLRIGHLLSLLHFGSMPTDVCKANITLFAREVLPHLAPLWDDKYEDRWWPERLRAKRPAAVAPAMAAAS